jgi:hypothetical protein
MSESKKIVSAANGGAFGTYPSKEGLPVKDTRKPVDNSKKSPKPFG